MAETVNIRVLGDSDVENVLSIRAQEGWTTPKNVVLAARAMDPEGVFAAVDADGKLIGVIGACNLDERTAFISTFIVIESHRGMGIGRQLMNRALAHAGDRNVGLAAVLSARQTYEKIGFTIKSFLGETYKGTKPEHINFRTVKDDEVNVVNFEAKFHETLLDYDNSVHPIRRQKFLDQLMASDTITLLAIQNDAIVGYGCVQPTGSDHSTFYIGPVYADDDKNW